MHEEIAPRRAATKFAQQMQPPAIVRVTGPVQRSTVMARYSESASKDVKKALHKRKKGTLRSGKDGKGGKGGVVRSRKQAIAIGLSEARQKGKKVPAPKKKAAKKKTWRKKTPRKNTGARAK
jgi:hypothetical protein